MVCLWYMDVLVGIDNDNNHNEKHQGYNYVILRLILLPTNSDVHWPAILLCC